MKKIPKNFQMTTMKKQLYEKYVCKTAAKQMLEIPISISKQLLFCKIKELLCWSSRTMRRVFPNFWRKHPITIQDLCWTTQPGIVAELEILWNSFSSSSIIGLHVRTMFQRIKSEAPFSHPLSCNFRSRIHNKRRCVFSTFQQKHFVRLPMAIVWHFQFEGNVLVLVLLLRERNRLFYFEKGAFIYSLDENRTIVPRWYSIIHFSVLKTLFFPPFYLYFSNLWRLFSSVEKFSC